MADDRDEPHSAAASTISDVELAGYLDELLPIERASALETALRTSPALQQRLAALIRRRDQGGHSVGEIWRRQRLSCLSRSDLGAYLLGVLEPALAEYVRFHLHTIGCRLCAANLFDLQKSSMPSDEQQTATRRQRYFESSAAGLGPSTSERSTPRRPT